MEDTRDCVDATGQRTDALSESLLQIRETGDDLEIVEDGQEKVGRNNGHDYS